MLGGRVSLPRAHPLLRAPTAAGPFSVPSGPSRSLRVPNVHQLVAAGSIFLDLERV